MKRNCFSLIKSIISLSLLIFCISNVYAGSFSTSTCWGNMKLIGSACEKYAEEHKGKFPDSLKDISHAYLKKLPECLITEMEYIYTVSHNPERYTISCRGWAHRKQYGEKNLCYSSENSFVETREPIPSREEYETVTNRLKKYEEDMFWYDVNKFLKNFAIYIILSIALLYAIVLYISKRLKKRKPN